MMYISKSDRELIKNLIGEAEKKTSSELVPMIIHHSDVYPAAHFRAAIIVSFLFSLGLYFSPLSIINPIYFLWIQIPGLFAGYWLGHIPFIKRNLITESEIEHEVTQRAYQAFFHHHLHLTRDRNGVLIFVSMIEQKIKIITDIAVAKKVEQKVWDEILVQFGDKMKNKEFISGLSRAIDSVGSVLENAFPSNGEKPANELNNALIIEKE